jgi:hypothetical protein
MTPSKYKEYINVVSEAFEKLKMLGVTRVLTSCKVEDKVAVKLNALFGLTPICEIQEPEKHTVMGMELR